MTEICGIDTLEHVVGGREVGTERGGGRVLPRRVELRTPERRLVRLVADHEVLHVGVDGSEDADVRREHRRRREAGLDLARRIRVDGENYTQSGVLRRRDRAVEKRLLLDDDGFARHEAHADHGLLQPERGHLRVEGRSSVVGVFRRVVVRPDVRGNGDRRPTQ